jgi:hypothetical protein
MVRDKINELATDSKNKNIRDTHRSINKPTTNLEELHNSAVEWSCG